MSLYKVLTDDGNVYRRNRRHLRLTAETPTPAVEMPSLSLPGATEERQPETRSAGPSQDTEPTGELEVTPVTADEPDQLPRPSSQPTLVKFSCTGRAISRPAYLGDYVC